MLLVSIMYISPVNLVLFVFFSRATVSAFNCLVVLLPLLIVLAFCHALANQLMMIGNFIPLVLRDTKSTRTK